MEFQFSVQDWGRRAMHGLGAHRTDPRSETRAGQNAAVRGGIRIPSSLGPVGQLGEAPEPTGRHLSFRGGNRLGSPFPAC